jgi:AcrR family transcriptional regulator
MNLSSTMTAVSNEAAATAESHVGTPFEAEVPVTRAEKKAQSRRRILDAARDVFFRDGFMLANLDEVATRAGVAKGTLYRYFESKADLYVAVLAENGMSFFQKMRDVAREGTTAIDSLRVLVDFYLDHWTEHRDYFQIFWAIDNQALIGGLPQDALDEVKKLWEGSLDIVNEVLVRGVRDGEFDGCDTWEVSYVMWTLANGMIHSEHSATRRELRRRPLREAYREAIDLILLGISRQS